MQAQREEVYSEQLNILESIRKGIDSLKKQPKSTANICQMIRVRVINTDHISIIVALHNGKYLENLLLNLQTQYQEKKSQEIEKFTSVLYLYGYECFFKYLPEYHRLFEFFNPKISKFIIGKSYVDCGGKKNQRYIKMAQLLSKFEQLKRKDKQTKKLSYNLNEYITIHFYRQYPVTGFQQCVFTYIRIQIEALQTEIIKKLSQRQSLCCKFHIQEGKPIKNISTINQNFKADFPLKQQNNSTNQSNPKYLMKKYVVGYLNSNGGIYYLGIEYKSEKPANFNGLGISQQLKRYILKWFLSDVVLKIYPPDQQKQDEDETEQNNRMALYKTTKINEFDNINPSSNQQYAINKHISIDFINFYNPKTWFYSRLQKDIRYIIRCKVKKGDKYQLYLFNHDGSAPESFIYQDDQLKKLTAFEYYNQIYDRLRKKQKNGKDQSIQEYSLCKFHISQHKNQ